MESYTAEEVAALDRHTVESLGVDVLQLMEVAGMRSAEIARAQFGDAVHVTALVGPGGNGGDALVAAKWLLLWGHSVDVLLSHPEENMRDVTKHQLGIWSAYGGTVSDEPPDTTECIIDGLIGYSLHGNPQDRVAELIRWANATHAPILALDVPSGLNATSGLPMDPCIHARRTAVFGVMKTGLLTEEGARHAGSTELVDIGFPRIIPFTRNV